MQQLANFAPGGGAGFFVCAYTALVDWARFKVWYRLEVRCFRVDLGLVFSDWEGTLPEGTLERARFGTARVAWTRGSFRL